MDMTASDHHRCNLDAQVSAGPEGRPPSISRGANTGLQRHPCGPNELWGTFRQRPKVKFIPHTR